MKFPALLVAVLMLAVLLVRFNLHFQKLCNTLAYNLQVPSLAAPFPSVAKPRPHCRPPYLWSQVQQKCIRPFRG